MLRVENLSKAYGKKQVVSSVSFEIKPGEVVALLGRNGAGKSSVIKMLCQLVRPSTGQIWLNEKPLLKMRNTAAINATIGAVIEAPCFYPHLSIYRNLLLLARLRGVSPAVVEAMLKEVGLGGKTAQTPFLHCSQGMKQRLGLATAFLHTPYLAILDEPSSGLDPVGAQNLYTLIQRLRKNHSSSVLLCTHLLHEVELLCNRALVMDKGRIVLDHPLTSKKDIQPIRELFADLAGKDSPFEEASA